MNKHVRDIFITRAKIVNYVRKFLDNLGFLEVSPKFQKPPKIFIHYTTPFFIWHFESSTKFRMLTNFRVAVVLY